MPNCRPSEHPFWLITEKTERTRPMIQRLTVLKNSNHSYTWKTTEETRLEVGYFGAHDYAGGTMGTRKSATVGHKWTVRKGSKNLRVGREYMKYKGGCARTNGTIYYTGAYKGEPWQRTGSSWYQNYPASWTCKRRFSVPMAAKTWYVRSSSVLYDGWFELGGLSLGASQDNTKVHRAVVARVKGRPVPRICGDNDFPIHADRMKEIVRRR